jgi:hypothetical protein
MSSQDEETIQFQFNFRGIEVEIAGDRRYVDTMYQDLMGDIEAARRAAAERNEVLEVPDEESVVWVHRCSEMMRKIYMVTSDDLNLTALSNALDPKAIGMLYVDKYVFDDLLPNIANDRTLWAELTEKGREKINNSTE